jgi:predicted nucleotidyltransferase
MISREQIIAALQLDKELMSEKFGVDEIGLFGSYARNEQTEDSDIDVLIKLREPKLKALIGVLDFLESKFQKKVDLVTDGRQLSERFRRMIKAEIVYA